MVVPGVECFLMGEVPLQQLARRCAVPITRITRGAAAKVIGWTDQSEIVFVRLSSGGRRLGAATLCICKATLRIKGFPTNEKSPAPLEPPRTLGIGPR